MGSFRGMLEDPMAAEGGEGAHSVRGGRSYGEGNVGRGGEQAAMMRDIRKVGERFACVRANGMGKKASLRVVPKLGGPMLLRPAHKSLLRMGNVHQVFWFCRGQW